jgi:tRNA dimethylallyltransferase
VAASPDAPVICLAGPTAAGKTALAVALSQRLPIDIISVDSAMVYRGLDIGTAKPDRETQRLAPHALIDIREPSETYSAGDFRSDALRLIQASHARGRLPLLVGGTMLYFRALRRGLADLPGRDPRVRAELDARAQHFGWPALHRELARVDPVAAERINPQDRQRIQRALEVHQLTGIPISTLQARSGSPPALRFHAIALLPGDRAALYRRIEQRCDAMFAAGFVAEVARLRDLPNMRSDLPAMRAVGYRQVWELLDGDGDLTQARDNVSLATRRYAKRQLTWLRGESDHHVVDCLRPDALDRALEVLRNAGLAGAN